MKTITLTQGLIAFVDDEDYKELTVHKWRVIWQPRQQAFSAVRADGRQIIRMHRQIMEAQPGQDVDHINHNTLDNRRENLRICTHAENMRNMRNQRLRNGTSIYKGVSWYKQSCKWRAKITMKGHQYHLGHFTNEYDAALAYDTAARKMFGEFALTNFSYRGNDV